MSPYQLDILRYVKAEGQATTSQIIDRFKYRYFRNARKHVQATLTRMVKAGKIERIKRGTYQVCDQHTTQITIDPGQMTLPLDSPINMD